MYLPKSARLIDRQNKAILEVSRCVKPEIFNLVCDFPILGFEVRKYHNEKTNKRYVTLSKDVTREQINNLYNVAADMCNVLNMLTRK